MSNFLTSPTHRARFINTFHLFNSFSFPQLSKKVEAIALKRKISAKIVAAASMNSVSQTQCADLKNLLIQLRQCYI